MMNIKENVLKASLDERWENYRTELKVCKGEFSEEAVHDLRVATRRLLAVLDIVRTLDPHPGIQKARRTLKDQLDALDELRDTQVMLVDVTESVADYPELKLFEDDLAAREKKLLRLARKEIRELRTPELKKRIGKIRLALDENVQGRKLTARLLSAVDQAYARARQALSEIEAEQSASIHRLRVAFKKFRYMVEIVNPVLKNYPEAHLQRMHEYQSKMGDVQDVEVLLSALREFTEQNETFAPARARFEEHRLELIAGFMEGKDALDVFWRSTPQQKFDWEKTHAPVHRSSRHSSGSGDAQIRERQSASVDQQGQKENGKNRTRVKGTGDGIKPDPDQPLPARSPNGKDSAQSI